MAPLEARTALATPYPKTFAWQSRAARAGSTLSRAGISSLEQAGRKRLMEPSNRQNSIPTGSAQDVSRHTAHEGAIATALIGLPPIVDDGISDERIRSGGSGHTRVALRYSWSVDQNRSKLLPSTGI